MNLARSIVSLAIATAPVLAHSNPPLPSSGPAALPPTPVASASALGVNLILNGDFETTSISGCAYNLNNLDFTNGMANTSAFGTAGETDVMSNAGACYLLDPQSGQVKVGLASTGIGTSDGFAFTLSAPLVPGSTYTVSFWAVAYAADFAPDVGAVEIGVSTDNSSFGSLVFAPTPLPGAWQNFSATFAAPSNGGYLTVQNSTLGDVWNHIDNFTLEASGPTSYCTCGTTTNGCCAAISVSNQPSLSFAHPCVLSVANVEGQKSGIIFYGVTGAVVSPWNGNSVLCVKAPVQRTGTQNSGGAFAQCNGSLTLDWNAYRSANPGALGSPFSVGQAINAQAWFRDPSAVKTTNLSDALQMSFVP